MVPHRIVTSSSGRNWLAIQFRVKVVFKMVPFTNPAEDTEELSEYITFFLMIQEILFSLCALTEHACSCSSPSANQVGAEWSDVLTD